MLTLAVDYATKGEFNRLRIEGRTGTMKRNTTCWLRKLERKSKMKHLGKCSAAISWKSQRGWFYYTFSITYDHNAKKKKEEDERKGV